MVPYAFFGNIQHHSLNLGPTDFVDERVAVNVGPIMLAVKLRNYRFFTLRVKIPVLVSAGSTDSTSTDTIP